MMMENQSRGKYGEDMAVSYLINKGYEILERNFRFRKGEIDIIALWKNELLVFVEVKLRKDAGFGDPESFVTSGQEYLIINTAEEYIYGINWKKDIRFDIIAISGSQVEHIEDAFY